MRERMGSGGLRGLQILRSDAYSARGGFDSHAFPPYFRALLRSSAVLGTVALLAVACGEAHGAGAGADSSANPAPVQAAVDTTRRVTQSISGADALRSSKFKLAQGDSARARRQLIAAADTARRR